jgi:uncharacterized lipoprotein YmbA
MAPKDLARWAVSFFPEGANMRILLFAVSALLLAGCGSAQEHGAYAVIQDGATCRTMGAQPGSERYDRCMRAQRRNRPAEDAE